MNALIARTTAVAKGSNFGSPSDPAYPVNGAALLTPHRYATPLLIPVLFVGHTLENTTLLINGLCDGIVAGFTDDRLFLQAVANAPYLAGYNAAYFMAAHLDQWRTDPVGRMTALSDSIYRYLQNHVCDPVKAKAADLGTLQGWMDYAWLANPAMIRAKMYQALAERIDGDPLTLLAQSLGAWWDDFNTRMMDGAEKNAWIAEPFPYNALISGANAGRRTFFYATGYGTGYVAEQAAVGIVTGGTVALGRTVLAKGTKLATRLAARTSIIIAARASILKKSLASATMSLELRLALEEGLTVAARTPAAGAGSKNVLTVIQESYSALPSGNVSATAKHLIDGIAGSPRISALSLIPGGSLEYLASTARLSLDLGTEATEKALRNWPKLANSIAPNGESGLANDLLRYSDFRSAFKLQTLERRTMAKEFLESMESRTAQQVFDKAWLPSSAEKVFPKLYRYSVTLPPEINGLRKLTAHNGAGWYCSPQKLESSAEAVGVMQLLYSNPPPLYRIEFDFSAVSNNVRLPKGRGSSAEWSEILTKDYTGDSGFGQPGGGFQLLVDGAEINPTAIYELGTGNKVWPIP